MTVFSNVSVVSAAPAPKPEPTYVSTAKPIGILDVTLTSAEKEDFSLQDTDPIKLLSKAGGLKKSSVGGTKKSGMGAKRLSSNSAIDTKLESFESLEKRNDALLKQESQLNGKLQDLNISEGTNSGRVAALLREEDQQTSIYRSSTSPATSYSAGGSQFASSARSFNPGSESHVARDKYANVKSISSDQFFGREEEGNQVVRAKLQSQYGNSTAISSDMLYGREISEESDDFHGGTAAEGISLDKLKDSVSGFFENIQRRIG